MEPSTVPPAVGSSVSFRILAGLALAVLGVIIAVVGVRDDAASEPTRLRLATGPESGTYHALGSALGRLLEVHGVATEVELVPTDGSVANMELIARGNVDLAFVQSDTPSAPEARLVASLYDEILHVLVAGPVAQEVRTIHDLRGRRVAVGPEGSGTRQVVEWILGHFRVQPLEELALGPTEASRRLVEGSIDAAFFLTAVPSRTIETLAQSEAVWFLSLGDAQEEGNEADALALVNPRLQAVTIPRATYVRLPRRPVRSVAVAAELVARRTLDPRLVHAVTQELFAHRLGLTDDEGRELPVAVRIREAYAPGTTVTPYHPGAVTYYRREAPPFFVEYAEAISLALTLAVGAYSGWIALRGWLRRRRKNRIDAYLLEVEALAADDLGSLSLVELCRRRDALDDIRHRAFGDFVAERLAADESFTIFQNFLRGERAAIEHRIREKGR